MVVVDHGNQVFSYYQHLDSLKVKEGEKVRAGDVIGGVGRYRYGYRSASSCCFQHKGSAC